MNDEKSTNPTNSHAPRVVGFDTIPEAVRELSRGRPVIVVDNEDRENEGDLVVAAQFADADMINFMAAAARGLICVPMPADYLDRLGIPMMVTDVDDRAHASPFTVSVEAAHGVFYRNICRRSSQGRLVCWSTPRANAATSSCRDTSFRCVRTRAV